MRTSVSFAVGVAVDLIGFGGSRAQQISTIYEETWDHHKAGFMSLDVAKTVEDYSEDAHLITLNHLTGERQDYYGKDGAKDMFSLLYSRIAGPDGSNVVSFADGFEIEEPRVDGDTILLAWNCSTSDYEYQWATDTFVMGSDGKFTHHNIYYFGAPRGQSVEVAAETMPSFAKPVLGSTIYEKTWDHHKEGFMSLDVATTVEDYSEDAHLITLNHMTGERQDYYGKDGARDMFSLLYSRIAGWNGTNVVSFADGFESEEPKVDGNTMFLAWNCSTSAYEYQWATDTFVMGSDGKFTHHNIYYSGLPIGNSDIIMA